MKRIPLRAPWRRILASASLMALLPWATQAAPPAANPHSVRAQASTCALSYTVSQWADGFTADVKVTNSGAALSAWTVAWSFPGNQQITSAWSATVAQSGAGVTARNMDYNSGLPTGGSQSFGFQATYSGTNSAPTNFTLNGAACTTDGSTPTLPPSTATPTLGALTPTATTPPNTPGVFQAETAVLSGDVVFEDINAGYNGSGYVNFPATGGALEFQNVSSTGGSTALRFRYALGTTTARAGRLVVNGVGQPITFDPTGAWTTWQTKEVVAALNSGSGNTIRLESNGQDLGNIDELALGSAPITTVTPIPPTAIPTTGPTRVPTTVPTPTPSVESGRQMEDLNRGVISVRQGSNNLVSWRLLGTDPADIAFNVYRGTTKLNGSPLTGATNYTDAGAASDSSYTVRPVVGGQEQAASAASLNFSAGYLDVPLQVPAGGSVPDGSYTYVANDASVGDLDGDGQYEIVLKWDPTNAKDNSQAGYTGNVYIDAYRLNGTRLWRIDLGRNIRAGAHYTQFQVYDYDGDGKAEVVMKTADGTKDGTGKVIGNASADYRNSSGYILNGPEYLTVFSGQTGAALDTANYDPPRGTVSGWGDSYGNRVDRFLAGTAYLDGQRPSIIMTRGYYTRSVIAAWDFRNGQLTKRWTFDSNVAGSRYTGQGNHQLSIADADGDGRDEVMFGSMVIDDNGRALWNNDTHHGDAYHVGDLIPSRPGLEVFKPSEHTDEPADWVGDARTGQIIWQRPSCGCDNGRGVAADIYAGSPGAEFWSSAVDGLRNTSNQNIGRKPSSSNFLIWWDGDPVRELLDGTRIDKYGTGGDTRLLTGSGVASNNGSKSTPALSGDILGDWREEVIWRTSDNRALRIYSTGASTTRRIYTLMHDPQYRLAIAWQNTAYNQPPHAGFFLGDGMGTPPRPNIYLR